MSGGCKQVHELLSKMCFDSLSNSGFDFIGIKSGCVILSESRGEFLWGYC